MSSGIDRRNALHKAFEFIYKSEIEGDYYEFGVYQGVSLLRAMMSDRLWSQKTNRNQIRQFYGFDSFEGFPKFSNKDHLNGYGVFQEGQFKDTNIELVRKTILDQGLPIEKVHLIVGLFSETLSSLTIKDNSIENSLVAIAHIDCDLYSSAKECLDYLDGRFVDGAVLLFDDWFCYRGRPDKGVRRAFNEWVSGSSQMVSKYFDYSWAGKAFIVNNTVAEQ